MSLPKGYKRLEYIQSSGTQYVDTLFKPNQDTRVVMDFISNGVDSGFQALFGARNGSSSAAFCMWLAPNAIHPQYGNVAYNYTQLALDYVQRLKYDINKNVAKVGNESVNFPYAPFSTNYTICLLSLNSAGTVDNRMAKGLTRSCQIYDNGLLERDFIPCKNADGEVGLYDRVYHEFYRNSGTGEFTAGPEMVHEDYVELEYIESTGTQWTDTLLKANPTSLRVVMDFEYTAAHTATSLFGSSTGSNWSIVPYGDPVFYVATSAALLGQTTDLNTPYHLDVQAESGTLTVGLNGAVESATYTGSLESATTITLFGHNVAGSVQQICSMLLRGCQMYVGGVLTRDYVPMLHPSGVAGLWDSVNERFYASATTTDFLAGPEAQTVPKAPANFRVEAETDTLVTLAWDASDEVLGYRLYRQGQLLADTTETFVSVAVEPFAGAVFTLTAYNENGEGKGTSLTYYSIPENPLLYLITDRTQQDVSERNPKGYYAASDLNRVGYAMDYLANIIRGYGYTLEVNTKTDWTDEGWKLSGEMVKYLQSLNNLKGVFSTLVELPETMEKINYVDANNIEQLLLTIDETVARVVAGFTRANAFALRSGAKGLPVSQSDRGRNWGQLDAMETTWANWQLATWYLLLYGNLKAEGVVT